jgi:hypothetical protein
MLDERLVYAKTAKGVAEVNARSGAVSLAARRVLIMIDGKRALADLAPLARRGELDSIIEQLEAQALIQQTQAAPAVAGTAPADHTDELAEDRLVASFEAVKRRAVRELSDRLGPDAEVMAMRIESCRNATDLRQRLHEAERLVAGMLGDAQAQEFLRALRRR